MREKDTYAGVPGSRKGSIDVISSSGGRAGSFGVGDEIINVTNAGGKCFVTAKAMGHGGEPLRQIWDLTDGSPRMSGLF